MDARGFVRPFDFLAIADAADGCDIGAYEVQDANGDGLDDALVLFGDGFELGDLSLWDVIAP